MAIYGIGANYEGKYNKKEEFINNECACIGWEEDDAPALHSMLRRIKIGDFIYMKSMVIATKELSIKAVGIVVDDEIKRYGDLGKGMKVKWIWSGEKRIPISKSMYRNNVFNNTLYEEFNPEIQKEIVNLAI